MTGADAPDANRDVRRSARALVYVDDLELLDLDPQDRHHLGAVLRLAAGEPVIAADGGGRWRSCVVVRPADGGSNREGGRGRSGRRHDGVVLEANGPVIVDPEPSPTISVAFAMAKGDRTDWTVQKLTEIGVDVIWPMVTTRTVIRLDTDDVHHRHDRLARIAREAAAQSRRSRLPDVREPAALATVVAALDAGTGEARFAEPGGGPFGGSTNALLVGPEGGWTDVELSLGGLACVSLGPSVLRSETAALVAGTLLAAARARIVSPG